MAASKWREYAALLSHMCSGWNGYPRGKWYARAEVDMISIDLGIERPKVQVKFTFVQWHERLCTLEGCIRASKVPSILKKGGELDGKDANKFLREVLNIAGNSRKTNAKEFINDYIAFVEQIPEARV